MTIMRVSLRWYCERPKSKLCFRKEEMHDVADDRELENLRAALFAMPFSVCTCGGRIVRSMHVTDPNT